MGVKVHLKRGKDGRHWLEFWCQGCNRVHAIRVASGVDTGGPGAFEWDGNFSSPTVHDAILTKTGDGITCDAIIKAGKILYLADSTHQHGEVSSFVDMTDWLPPGAVLIG